MGRVIKPNVMPTHDNDIRRCIHHIAENVIPAYHRPDLGIPPHSWSLGGELNG